MSKFDERQNAAIDAQNNLTQAVADWKGRIDTARAAEKADFEAWKADWLNTQPLPHNDVANPFLEADTIGEDPAGYSGVGLNVTAVHPYTKGFQGPYWSQTTIDSEVAAGRTAASPGSATQARPYPFGVYNLGPRWAFWGGGFSSGWGNLPGGKIIKVTGPADSRKSLHISRVRTRYARLVRLQCWVYMVTGSGVVFGDHAGLRDYSSNWIQTEKINGAPNGWLKVDLIISTSSTVNLGYSWGCAIGFKEDEAVEAYIAIPYIYAINANGAFSG